ncbi:MULTISPECIES: hypothetical protein [Achromobacter]|uniref:hypothetical protein n=1 Tax=Achromobacter TaxID=222 RepID=UPI0011141DEE|nr:MULTISPECIES: hypothetical protein [Achromobacter]
MDQSRVLQAVNNEAEIMKAATDRTSLSFVEYVAAAVADALSAFGVPGASILGAAAKQALQARFERRAQEASQILLEEIRSGAARPQDIPLEEPAAIMLRYARAVHEGVGRLNLRLLASILAGQLAREAVYADEFYRWADVLAGLTPEEVVVLAGYLRHMPEDLRTVRLVELGAEVYQGIYGSDTDHWGAFEATRGALLRTGLLSISATGGAIGGGTNIVFAPTAKLQELGRLVEMQGVLDRSGLAGASQRPAS